MPPTRREPTRSASPACTHVHVQVCQKVCGATPVFRPQGTITRRTPRAATDVSAMPPMRARSYEIGKPCMLACPHAAVPNKRQSRTRVKAACQHHMADTTCANRPMRHERGDPTRSASPAHKSNICTTPAARLPGGRAGALTFGRRLPHATFMRPYGEPRRCRRCASVSRLPCGWETTR